MASLTHASMHGIPRSSANRLQPRDRGAIASDGVAKHDQEASVGRGLANQRRGPKVGEIARGPLADDLARRAWKQGRVLRGYVVGRIALPEAVEVVDLLAERRALDRRMPPHRRVPPARAAALRADPHVLGGASRPSLGALGDLQRRVPWPDPVHETCKSNGRLWDRSQASAAGCGAGTGVAASYRRRSWSAWPARGQRCCG